MREKLLGLDAREVTSRMNKVGSYNDGISLHRSKELCGKLNMMAGKHNSFDFTQLDSRAYKLSKNTKRIVDEIVYSKCAYKRRIIRRNSAKVMNLRLALVAIAYGQFLGACLGQARAVQPESELTPKTEWFGIRVVDSETGRGVPLVRFRTTAQVDFWTDSNGWIAFFEPGLMDQEIYFGIESPGYEHPADGFGFHGVRLKTTPGDRVEVKLQRTQLAERIYRVTGSGIYRDSELLDMSIPVQRPTYPGGVVGQDSVQMVEYGGQCLWLWGDTSLANYPLGNFHVTAALTPLPGRDGFEPEQGVPLEYFINRTTGMVAKMLPDTQPGVVWLWGLCNVPDEHEKETLLAHYSRHLKLGEMVEQGIAEWDRTKQQFVKVRELPLTNTWQVPRGQAVQVNDEQGDFMYFAEPFATTRVPATRAAVLDPARYEALAWDLETKQYRWQREREPTTQPEESKMIDEGILPAASARYKVVAWDIGEEVELHRGSIHWNEFRQRWILVASEINRQGQPSMLGEVWCAESASIAGPWLKAIKVATHPNYSFYNPRHHRLFDQAGGRIIYFEGTYTQMFSGNPTATPRYDYNQIMYRLDLSRLPWVEMAGR
ncbi:MAG TPA: hypothetical protein PKD64_03990 [Pirellulaceae bacterium]|nr:hypothetical protein [Pirellulaceae bacterium]HMO91332.1 hypothetical protein [Pirellulaceae bacterium]HMP70150.1 hypothetical protein [Pirellulaceae bacterium]